MNIDDGPCFVMIIALPAALLDATQAKLTNDVAGGPEETLYCNKLAR
jgi:hypothetical protein